MKRALYLWDVSLQESNWSGVFPQNPQGAASLFKYGLWLAQVPANFPSFFAHSFIEMPPTPSNNNPIVINSNSII